MRNVFLLPFIGVFVVAATAKADDDAIVAKLRDAFRNTVVQLREAQNQVATLQATQTANEQKIKELTARIDSLNKQAVADRNTSANMIADLNAKIAAQLAANQALQAANEKWKHGYNQLTSFAQKLDVEKAKLSDKSIKLQRQVDDQQIKNIQMYKVGMEILDRYRKFGLGDALLAREPFVGTTKIKFQNLVQNYSDKLADQRIKP